jgi:acetyl-CoA acetyltransferase
MSTEVYIVDAVRTAVGKYGGALSFTRPDDMAAEVIKQLMTEADSWLDGNHNPDDITLVVIKHK